MKVFELRNAFGIDNLTLAERPEPRPGPGQVLVKMRAWSLNYRDLLVVKGAYNPKLCLPFILLSDGVGEVAAVGAGVQRVKTGERVAGIFMQGWVCGALTDAHSKTALGGALEGILAEFVLFDENGVVHVPPHLTHEEAATLPCAALTAWHALVSEGNLTAGDTILIQGTGGVSIFALQFAKVVGARVIATSSSDDKLARVRQLGASDGINYKQTPGWGGKARELTGGVGVDHVVEVGGVGTLNESLRGVRSGGRVSLIGVLSGGSGPVNLFPVLMKNVRVQGIYVGSREMFEAMNRAVALHQLRPIVDRAFPFAESREALRYLESGAHFGKVCIRA